MLPTGLRSRGASAWDAIHLDQSPVINKHTASKEGQFEIRLISAALHINTTVVLLVKPYGQYELHTVQRTVLGSRARSPLALLLIR